MGAHQHEPAVHLPAGRPDAARQLEGHVLGSGSDAWKYWDERRAGNISETALAGVEGGIARSAGTCMTMGTASTMTSIAEAMGLTLPGASVHPGGRRQPPAHGHAMRPPHRRDGVGRPDARESSRPQAFENAITVAMAWAARPTPSST
jgi:dihydroxyacid dehydratase/phosphogluconate dehydratase